MSENHMHNTIETMKQLIESLPDSPANSTIKEQLLALVSELMKAHESSVREALHHIAKEAYLSQLKELYYMDGPRQSSTVSYAKGCDSVLQRLIQY